MRSLFGLLLALSLAGCALVVRPDPAPIEAPRVEDAEIHAVGATAIDGGRVAPGAETPYWGLVRRGGPLVVGINPHYPPFGVPVAPQHQGEGPAFVGFDIDLAIHLGQTLGVPIVLRPVPSAEVPDRLNDGTIDVALAGLTRTAYRAAQVNFSAPYLTVSQAALVERRFVEGSRGTDEERRRNSMQSYYDLADKPGVRIGVAQGTRPARLAEENFPGARVVPFPTIEEASQALIGGEVNALVHDAPYVRVWGLLHAQQASRFSALLAPVTEEPISIAIRKGDLEFLTWLDAYVEEVRGDGTVQRLYRKHFIDAAWAPVADLGGER